MLIFHGDRNFYVGRATNMFPELNYARDNEEFTKQVRLIISFSSLVWQMARLLLITIGFTLNLCCVCASEVTVHSQLTHLV